MDLILWRHAEAGDRLIDPVADLERPLSPKGERQARRVADWLNQFLPDSARVLSSPALRCQQTAAALGRRVKKTQALGPDGDIEGLLAFYRSPLGQKMIRVTPLVTAERVQISRQWGQQRGSQMMAELKARGTLNDKGQCPAAPAASK